MPKRWEQAATCSCQLVNDESIWEVLTLTVRWRLWRPTWDFSFSVLFTYKFIFYGQTIRVWSSENITKTLNWSQHRSNLRLKVQSWPWKQQFAPVSPHLGSFRSQLLSHRRAEVICAPQAEEDCVTWSEASTSENVLVIPTLRRGQCAHWIQCTYIWCRRCWPLWHPSSGLTLQHRNKWSMPFLVAQMWLLKEILQEFMWS